MATLPPLTINQSGSRDISSETQTFHNTRPDQLAEDARTPTRDSFAAANGKRTLPMSPTEEEPPPDFLNRSNLQREGSHRSSNSQAIHEDVDMGGSEDEAEGSENDSQDDGTERPSKKKKKGQRFFCTEYPPCNLSFTRSEHLARHIRKHTGERPFQCHCSRRFSRLDNLRQHAQTVHVNEEIPGDSLAATGTRFQRQIRTDRVRPPGARSRASTAGSQSGHRGHGRNLSTSSIASTTSNASTISNISSLSRENSGRRPHSMTLGDQRRGGLTIDTLRASPTRNYAYTQQTGSGGSTPTSHYAGTPSSPFGSTLGSPITLPRNPNNGTWADRHMARRLSVPSGTSVFQAGTQYPNQGANINPSANSSVLGSPTSSTFSMPRTEVASDDWRRRTWHPNTYSNYSYPRPATSGLSYSQTPNEPRPAFAPQALAAAGQTPKLPGIETFDQMSNRPSTPPQRAPVPNAAITPARLSVYPPMDRRQPGHGHQRGVHSWDMSLHQNLTRLEITGDTPPRDTGAWVQQQATNQGNSLQSSPQRPIVHPATHPNIPAAEGPPMQVPPQLVLPSQPGLSAGPPPPPQNILPSQNSPPPPHLSSQPHAVAPPGTQRGGWPMSVPHKLMQRPGQSSGESSSGESIHTPTSYRDYQPQVIHANGYIEPQLQAAGPKYSLFPTYQVPSQPHQVEFSRRPDTSGLDALVAVATSESRQLPAQQ